MPLFARKPYKLNILTPQEKTAVIRTLQTYIRFQQDKTLQEHLKKALRRAQGGALDAEDVTVVKAALQYAIKALGKSREKTPSPENCDAMSSVLSGILNKLEEML